MIYQKLNKNALKNIYLRAKCHILTISQQIYIKDK